jgi:hypothetical protein
MELTAEERRFVQLYKNYSINYNDLEFRKLDNRWTSDGTKEKMWISIYTKVPIDTHTKHLLFNSSFDEQTVVNEIESFITSNIK